MELKHFILPATALAAAVFLLGGQRMRISELRVVNEELRVRIATARATHPAATPERPDQPDPPGKPIDWDKLAASIHDNNGGKSSGLYSIQRRLLAMDTQELLAALERIAAMDVDDVTRLKLENLILDPLCRKDPGAALDHFKGKLQRQEGMETFLLTHALRNWAKKDPAAATGWLDRELAAGTFEPRSLDGKNPVWTRLEAAVVFGQFAADPAKAEARLSCLSVEMRAEILGQADAFHKMSASDEIDYAAIVRRQLDEKGRVAAIAERAKRALEKAGGFAAVDEYMNSVYAAPDERELAADRVAVEYARSLALKKELRTKEIEAMRAWVARDAPAAVGRLTGEALGMAVSFGGGMEFADGSALALHYRRSDGNDDTLHAFLSKIDPKPNKAEARKLAENITEPAKREILMRKFE
jgi:hypothetical protein